MVLLCEKFTSTKEEIKGCRYICSAFGFLLIVRWAENQTTCSCHRQPWLSVIRPITASIYPALTHSRILNEGVSRSYKITDSDQVSPDIIANLLVHLASS